MFKKLRNLSLMQFIKAKKYYFLSIIAVFIGISIFYVVYFSFQLKEIRIQGLSPQKQLVGLASLENKSIVLLDVRALEQQLKDQNPFIKTISLEKEYPHTLSIIASIHYPVANLKTNGGFFQLSEDGTILSKAHREDKKLPIITYYQNFSFQGYQAGEQFSFKDIQYALHFLKKIQLLGININSIDIKGLHMLGLNAEETKQRFLFSAEKDQGTQDYQVEIVVLQLKREGKEFEELDVRFEKPIIKLRNKKI